MTADFPIAERPIAAGDLSILAIIRSMAAAIKMRRDKNINGSANGRPNLAPTKPVLHKKTKRYGAT